MRLSFRWSSTGRLLLLALAVPLSAGCTSRPHAPELTSETHYVNEEEGVSVQAPEGWSMRARGEAPEGEAGKERLLVQYRNRSTVAPASFAVSCKEVPETTPLIDCLKERALKEAKWQLVPPVESIALQGHSGVRARFTSRVTGEKEVLDVLAVRRGKRVYFFSALFRASDDPTRGEVQRAFESIQIKALS